jgi:hypothetical protein
MNIEIVTSEDLQEFKKEIIASIRDLISVQPVTAKTEKDRWMRSAEVRKLFGISAGTLQNMRLNGSLPFSKIGTTILYDRTKILNTLEANSSHKTQP